MAISWKRVLFGVVGVFVLAKACSSIEAHRSSTSATEKPEESSAVQEARNRVERCQLYEYELRELASDLRYGKIEPWKAQGQLNEIRDKQKRRGCDTAVADLGAALAPASAQPAPATKAKAAAAPPADPRCKGLDPEVCAALKKN